MSENVVDHDNIECRLSKIVSAIFGTAHPDFLTGENVMKSRFHVRRSQSRRFNEWKIVLLREGSSFFRRHGPQVTQVRLVTDEHDDDVGVGMVTKFPEPALDVFICQVFSNVVDKKSTDGAAIIPETGKKN